MRAQARVRCAAQACRRGRSHSVRTRPRIPAPSRPTHQNSLMGSALRTLQWPRDPPGWRGGGLGNADLVDQVAKIIPLELIREAVAGHGHTTRSFRASTCLG